LGPRTVRSFALRSLSLKVPPQRGGEFCVHSIMAESGNYQLLLSKLEEFRSKYYLNQLIRGFLFSLAALLGAYLIISLLEYRFFFPPAIRQILVYGGMVAGSGLLGLWIIRPLLLYFKVGKTLDNAEAARLIGSHFKEVEDRLLNILQLREQAGGASDNSLLFASINQKIEAIKPVPFSLAVDLKGNRRYLKYALPPVLALVFLVFAAPNVLRESNNRLIRNGEVFEREAPFRFLVENDPLEGIQFQDFLLQVKVEGDALPDQAFIAINGSSESGPYRLQKFSPNAYGYTFHKLAEDLTFHFEAAGFRSRDYTLRALPSPGLQEFEVRLDYPSYTGRKDEVLRNRGDLSVPVGTEATWMLTAENTGHIGFRFPDSLYSAERRGRGEFQFSRRIRQDEVYKIGLGNEQVSNIDSIAFRISAVTDRFPTINVERFVDSTNNKFLYFLGEAGDDYGLRNLNFNWNWETTDAFGQRESREKGQEAISLAAGQQRSAFNYNWDVSRMGLSPGDRITYYFEVWDNDGVNGAKSSRTASMTYEMATLEAFEQKTQVNNREIKDKLEKTLSDIEETRKETDRLKEKLMQKKELDWEDRKNLENLLEKRQEIQENVQDIQETFRENLSDQKDYKQYDEQLMKKQEQLQQMFEEVVSDELKKLFDEMEKLLEELTKEKGLEELQEMDLTDQQLENELDRMLDLFKQLELEQKMEDIVSKLEELAEKQDELAEQAADETSSPEDLAKQQDQLNEQFDKLREEMDQMDQLNQELSDPNNLPDTEQSEEQIEQGMEQSQEQMEQSAGSKQQGKQKQSQQQQQKSGEQMKQNSDMMEELAQQMSSALSDMQQQQTAEDLQALRQLLDNLIKLSFDQEDLMDELATVQPNNPRYTELVQEQFNIREDSRMVEDSLIALSKRVFEISSFVTRELADMNRYMDLGMAKLSDRRLPEARSDQQFVMTSMNNLALMLSEVMDQMQQQMASQMSGNQMCQKPGGGKPSNAQMKEMGNLQDQLNKSLQGLKEGQKPGQRNPLSSQQFAQMAAKQAAIRRALEQMGQQMNGTQEQGDMAKELKEIADQMEKTEEDLVNKVFNSEMLMRQQEIMTRLLEAEEALRQREIDPKRKSETANEISRDLPPSLQEYLKKRQAEIDLFKTVPADLKPYYKDLVEQYLNGLEF
jgi:hypothetical protein